ETFAAAVEPGDPVLVQLQALNGKLIEGKVTRTAWALEARTRTLRTEIDVPNPDGKLRPGLYAYATVVVEEHKDTLTVPATALVKEKDKTFCVAVTGNKAVRKPVEIGLNDGMRAEILAGLDGTESVVKANATSLIDGQPVKAANAETEAAKGAKP
ncbi:efflux RND transporter periplasmic adaptor subunit, partial [Singulisphaera rosea]